MLKRILLLGLLLALPLLVVAQDEEPESEEPVIPYYQDPTGFNVPLLGDNWERETADESIIYRDSSTNANMLVNTVRTTDNNEAITESLSAFISDDLGEPTFDGRVVLLNGTWAQQVYEAGDTTVSAFALVRSDRTFVIAYWEDSADYDMSLTISRLSVETDDDGNQVAINPLDGIEAALETLGLTTNTEPETVQDLNIDGDAWVQATYPTNATPFNALGYQFRNFTYVAVVQGELSEGVLQNADDIERLILGFFITPDNVSYLYLGLAASGLIFLALLVSMWLRWNNAKAELQLVEQIAEDN